MTFKDVYRVNKLCNRSACM